MNVKIDIKSLTLEELTAVLKEKGEKAFRAKQMYEWMHVKLARNLDEMTNLSKDFRSECKEWCEYRNPRLTARRNFSSALQTGML